MYVYMYMYIYIYIYIYMTFKTKAVIEMSGSSPQELSISQSLQPYSTQ